MKLFLVYTLFSTTANANSDFFYRCGVFLSPGAIVLFGAIVNHLCNVSLVFKLGSVSLICCVQASGFCQLIDPFSRQSRKSIGGINGTLRMAFSGLWYSAWSLKCHGLLGHLKALSHGYCYWSHQCFAGFDKSTSDLRRVNRAT